MRYLVALVALLAAAPAAYAGEARTPRGQVVAYECEQINPAETGFTCTFENGRPHIQLHEKQSEMSEAKRKRSEYEFNKIALRYFEFGGTTFPVNADFWPKGHYKSCGRSPNGPWYKFACWGITGN